MILFHGLSKLIRGVKIRIKKWGQFSVLDEKAAGSVGPCAHSDLDSPSGLGSQ